MAQPVRVEPIDGRALIGPGGAGARTKRGRTD